MMSSKSRTSSLAAPAGKKKSLQPRASSFNLQPELLQVDSKPASDAKTKQKTLNKTAFKAKPKPAHKDVFGQKKEKPQFDKVATKKFDDMLDGDLTDIPPLPKSMVKIFLSSTFSDMRAERNILAREVYPQLRDYCASHELDFQVVDMRWGVTEDSQNDHSVEKLCLLEVENCQKASRGPNFVVLSGNRYGFRPVPIEIDIGEFEMLRATATSLNLEHREQLDEWYKLDTNSIPPMYILQPIRSKFTFFADFSPGCDEPRMKDTSDWWKTFAILQNLLRKCAEEACKNKKLSDQRRHQYFLSVTECEIQDGILKAADVDAHCLVYKRELQKLSGPALNDETASRFIDVKKSDAGTEIDKEVEDLRETLIKKRIPSKLSKTAIKMYSVEWKPGGIDPDCHADHKAYVDTFCHDFMADCMGLIEKAIAEKNNLIQMTNYYTDYEETIHHLKFCLTKCQSFCGQENVLQAAKAYILDESGRKPFIIHAQSGVGKTSIMAMIMKSIPKWLKDKPHIKVIRFLGTTPNSNNIYNVMFSILGQLSDACDMIMSPISYRTMKNLVEFIPRYLRQVANTIKEPVIILLDSVDQLYPTHNAYAMEWLPTKLPPNVKLILSTLPEEHGILTNLRKVLPDKECYVEVPLLPESTGKLIVESYLKQNRRTLTEPQIKLILKVLKESPSPLFLKLLLDEAKKWHSYTPVSELILVPTVKEAINKLFENLEKKFGYALVSHALGYITIGLTGLTEFEIEDVLSCDDVVLNEVYKYHDPPVLGIVRIPPVLWARIRYDIKEYLVERISHGRSTLNWYHRQFVKSARDKYVSGGKDVGLHKNLMEIYLQDDGVRRTITLTNRKNLMITDADRQVTPQPYTTHNRRKLACLPYHVIRASSAIGPDIIKSKIFCNFKFLCTRIAAFSITEVKNDLADFLEHNKDEEIQMLLNFLSVSKEDLSVPVRFAVCLLAYIKLDDHHVTLMSLLEQAKQYLLSQKKPLLYPAFPCLAPRTGASSALEASLHGCSAVRAASNNLLLLKAHKEKDGFEEKSEYAIFNSANEDFMQIDLPHPSKDVALKNYALTGECVYYVTNSDLVAYSYQSKKSVTCSFSDMSPKWNAKTNSVENFTANAESTLGLLTFKKCGVLLDLQKMKSLQNFTTKRQFASFENAVFANSENEGKVIAVGRINNSTVQDTPQGPDNLCFACLFEPGKELPVKLQEVEMEIDTQVMALAHNDSWFIIATKGSNKQDANASDKQDTADGIDVQLLSYKVEGFSKESEISLPSPVLKLQGSPISPKVAAMTVDGTVYIASVSTGKISLAVHLNYPVTNFIVSWEESICLLSSAAGNVTLYDINEDKNIGAFAAHAVKIQDILLCDQQLVTLGSNHEMKSWSMQALIDETKNEKKDKKFKMAVHTLLDETNVSVLGVSADGHETITGTEDGYIKMWDTDTQELLRQYNIEIVVNVILVLSDGSVALLDKKLGKLLIFDIESGKFVIKMSDFPENVLAITTNSEKNTVYAVSSPKNGQVQIDVVSVQLKKISKTIVLQKGLTYESLDACLSKKERYLVLRSQISDAEYESIKLMWKKMGSFGEQPHQHKFTAVDLSQGNGGLMPCYRQMSKIPTLGTVMESYRGNTMLVATRRWVVFWEIPTGKCDQKLSKDKAVGMFYRPGWLGQDCRGTTLTLEHSPNNEFLVVGSEDGFLFIYSMEDGFPRGKTAPSTKHNAEVHKVAISPNSEWVASSCRSSVLKLWEASTGKEQFSMRVDAEVQAMMFTTDSRKLVMYTGTQTTRVLVFSVHDGKQKENME